MAVKWLRVKKACLKEYREKRDLVFFDDDRRIIYGLDIKAVAVNRRHRCPGQSRAAMSSYAGSVVISAASPRMVAEPEPAIYKLSCGNG